MNLASLGVYFLKLSEYIQEGETQISEVGPAWLWLQIVVGVSRVVLSEHLQGHSS